MKRPSPDDESSPAVHDSSATNASLVASTDVKCKVIFTQPGLGRIHTVDHLEKKLLVVRNRKLMQHMRAWKTVEKNLRHQLSQLESYKLCSDAMLFTVDRYRKQLIGVINDIWPAVQSLPYSDSSSDKGSTDAVSMIPQESKHLKAGQNKMDKASWVSLLEYVKQLKVEESTSEKSPAAIKKSRTSSTSEIIRSSTHQNILWDTLDKEMAFIEKFCRWACDIAQRHKTDSSDSRNTSNEMANNCSIVNQSNATCALCNAVASDLILSDEQCSIEEEIKRLKNKNHMLEQELQYNKGNVIEQIKINEQSLIRESKMQDVLIDYQQTVADLQSKLKRRRSTLVECDGECLLNKQLAEERLNELNELLSKYKSLHKRHDEIESKLDNLPMEAFKGTEWYKAIEQQLSDKSTDNETLKNELTEYNELLTLQKQTFESRLEACQAEESTTIDELKKTLFSLEEENSKLNAQLNTSSSETSLLLSQVEDLKQRIKTFISPLDDSCKQLLNRFRRETQRIRQQLNIERQQKEELRRSIYFANDKVLFPVCSSMDSSTQRKLDALEEILKSVRSEHKLLKENESVLTNELEITGIAYEEAISKSRQLCSMLSEKEDSYMGMLKDCADQKKCVLEMKEQGQRLIQEYETRFQNELRFQNEIITATNTRITELEQAQTDYELKFQELTQLEQKEIAEVSLLSNQLDDFREKCKNQRDELDFLRRKASKIHLELETSRFNERRLNEEKRQLIEQYKTQLSSREIKRIRRDREDLELLKFEVNELRESMKCSSCRDRRVDTVIARCFHVFCYQCLQARIDTRQRKCPQCNANFGTNDLHRIYLRMTHV